MSKLDFREQVKKLAEYVATRDYEWISRQEIMFTFNCGETKAVNLCKTLDKLSDYFKYHYGSLKYTGKPDEWKEDLKHEG